MIKQFLLKKPIFVNGTEVKSLDIDFDELDALDMERAGKNYKEKGNYVNVIELDAGYHFEIFCMAVSKLNSDISRSDLDRLKGKDYIEATKEVRRFFMLDSEE